MSVSLSPSENLLKDALTGYRSALITITIRLRFGRRSTLIRLQFDRATTIPRYVMSVGLPVCGLLRRGLSRAVEVGFKKPRFLVF